jgi:hypothetical protein
MFFIKRAAAPMIMSVIKTGKNNFSRRFVINVLTCPITLLYRILRFSL